MRVVLLGTGAPPPMHGRRPPAVRVTEIEEGIIEAGGVTVSAFLVDHDPVKPAFGFRFEGRRGRGFQSAARPPVTPLGAPGSPVPIADLLP